MPQQLKDKLLSTLKRYWGHGEFRPMQLETILSVIDGSVAEHPTEGDGQRPTGGVEKRPGESPDQASGKGLVWRHGGRDKG